jgi:hypothetical protein
MEMIKFLQIKLDLNTLMANKDDLYCGISYIVAGALAFIGTITPLLDMKNIFPDIYLDVSTLYLLWVPALLICVLGFVAIGRNRRGFSSAWFIAAALAGAILTVSSIVTSAGAIACGGQGSPEPSWRLGTGGLMLLAAFLWTMLFPTCRIIRRMRAKTREKRIMAHLLQPPDASLGRGALWECKYSLNGIEGSTLLPQH